MSCRHVRDWLHRDVEELDETQRLVLDDHLAACDPCRADRARLRQVRQIGGALPVPPTGAREHQRAIARALLEGSRPAAKPERRRIWIPAAAGVGALVAIAALIAVLTARGRGGAAPGTEPAQASGIPQPQPQPQPQPRPQPELQPAPATDVLESGALRAGTTIVAAGATIPANTQLLAGQTSQARLASARVVIAAGTEVRWVPIERTLRLDRFAIELGDEAELTVDADRVHVRRGQVRILDRAGVVLAQLEAGAGWTPPIAAVPARPMPPLGGRDAASAEVLMARARAQFAARDYKAATRTTEAALALGPRRADEAEARTFLGDIAQAEGDLGVAAARYAAVAADFAGTPAAESALYAAARVELRRARTDHARALLTRYLELHPAGRYADDVRRALAALPRSNP